MAAGALSACSKRPQLLGADGQVVLHAGVPRDEPFRPEQRGGGLIDLPGSMWFARIARHLGAVLGLGGDCQGPLPQLDGRAVWPRLASTWARFW